MTPAIATFIQVKIVIWLLLQLVGAYRHAPLSLTSKSLFALPISQSRTFNVPDHVRNSPRVASQYVTSTFKLYSHMAMRTDDCEVGDDALSGKLETSELVPSKNRLAKLGQGAFLAYALVSNLCTVGCFTLAWISHGRLYGKSPFRQWKAFGLIYAGLWTANNFLRPLRISAAIALSPLYDRAIDRVVARTGLQRGRACLVIALVVNVLGTLSALTIGATVASRIAQIPIISRG